MQRIEEHASPPQVLVVDDEPAIRAVLTMVLEAHGYEVKAAEDGPEALRIFPKHEWSAVITDRMMPGMNGDQLAESIRRVDAKIPIILVSGQCAESSFDFDAVVAKPFTSHSLCSALEAALHAN